MTTKTIRATLAEQLERSRLADEALDTIVACLAILNGEVARPAPLNRADVLRDLRSALIHLYVVMPQVDDAPSLRAALGRAKLLDEALTEGPPEIKAIDKAIGTLEDLIADKDQNIAEMEKEIAEIDRRASVREWMNAKAPALRAEIEVEDRGPMPRWVVAMWILYIAGVLAVGYGLAVWLLGV
jgi:hypothetical protein